MRIREWLSNIKWLILTLRAGVLVRRVGNWFEVICYYGFPVSRPAVKISFRNGRVLVVPRGYLFEAIAETLLLDSYESPPSLEGGTVVDVGASLGDFVLAVQSSRPRRVYAIEPDYVSYRWLLHNLAANGLRMVVCYNQPFSGTLLSSICRRERSIDFLKMDCEGFEYGLVNLPRDVLAKIDRLAIETHEFNGHHPHELAEFLADNGFVVRERLSRGRGNYLFARRPVSRGF